MDYDYNLLIVVLLRLFTLSLIVQLALDALFRWEWYEKKLGNKGLKFPIAFVVAYALCIQTQTDIVAQLFQAADGVAGRLTTALAVCGGTTPILAVFSKIEAMREANKTVIVQQQAARSGGGT